MLPVYVRRAQARKARVGSCDPHNRVESALMTRKNAPSRLLITRADSAKCSRSGLVVGLLDLDVGLGLDRCLLGLLDLGSGLLDDVFSRLLDDDRSLGLGLLLRG